MATAPSVAPFYTDPLWLGHELLAEGILTQEKFDSAVATYRAAHDVPFSEVLESLGIISSQRAAQRLAQRAGMPFSSRLDPDRVIARSLAQARARQIHAIPLTQVGNMLKIAVANPFSYNEHVARNDFPQKALSFSFVVSPKKDILAIVESVWTEESVADNPEKFLNGIIVKAIDKRVSDIHFETKATTLDIRFRIDGELVHETFVGEKYRSGVIQAVKIAALLNISERRLPQDGQFKKQFGSNTYSFRVSTIPTIHGEKVVIRIADDNANLRSFRDLGMQPEDADKFERLLKMPNGIIICTGPTGSGKTTLLFSAVDRLPSNSLNIHSLEDPVEYHISSINQTKVEAGIGLTFASALRSILRQDPDVVLVGEMRDTETAKIAIQASLTGHLCFSTLHTNDAAGSVTRLIDMGVESFLVASTVIGVLAQRLLRRICVSCKRVHSQSDLLAEQLNMPGHTFYEGAGCPECRMTGYKGRVGIFEVFPLCEHGDSPEIIERNITVQRIITQMGSKNSNVTEQDLLKEMLARGHHNLRQDGLLKAAAGITTPEEVFSNL